MVWSIVADGIFALSVLTETMAVLSLLTIIYRMPLREEFEPILAFYHTHISPVFAFPTPKSFPEWFPDAYAISFVLFFLFFISQMRAAAAPHEIESRPGPAYTPTAAESALDVMLPIIFCAFAAIVVGYTLLPLSTPFIALWLFVLKLNGNSSWFQISRSYYVNLFLVAGLTFLTLSLPR